MLQDLKLHLLICLIQSHKVECQHAILLHSMLNHTPLPRFLFVCRLLLFSYQEHRK